MKSILLILFITFSTIAYSQRMKIEWEDQVGREFSITVPSGTFSYGMIQDDNTSYDYKGNISKVGGLYLKYDYNGRVTGTSGSVN